MSNVTKKAGDTGCSSSPKASTSSDSKYTKPKTKRRRWDKKKRREDTPKHDKFLSRRSLKTPNYFFAVKIDDPRIKGVMQAVQDHIVEQDQILKHVVVSTKLAHLTVGLLHLPDRNSVSEAVSKMDKCAEAVQNIVSHRNFILQMKGLGHFDEEVIFAKVINDENEDMLRKLAEFLSQEFDEFKSSNPFDYTPHLTLMKLSKIQKNFNLRKKIRRLDKSLFQHLHDIEFGQQTVTSLQLLCMGKKDANGYYVCARETPFGTMEGVTEKSAEEKYAEYLSTHILASAACMSRKQAANEKSKDASQENRFGIGDIAEATVVSAMDEALKDVYTRND